MGCPTQKPLALLRRIIRASSSEGDVVLDPFCGCATTLIAAETPGRLRTGIDLSSLAVKLVLSRLQQAADDGALPGGGQLPQNVSRRADIPQRTDSGKLPPYKTHRHALHGKQEGQLRGLSAPLPVPQLEGGSRRPAGQGRH